MDLQVKRWYRAGISSFFATAYLGHVAYQSLGSNDASGWGAVAFAVGTLTLSSTILCFHQAHQKEKEIEEEAWKKQERETQERLDAEHRQREAIDQFQEMLELKVKADQADQHLARLRAELEQQPEPTNRFGPRKITLEKP